VFSKSRTYLQRVISMRSCSSHCVDASWLSSSIGQGPFRCLFPHHGSRGDFAPGCYNASGRFLLCAVLSQRGSGRRGKWASSRDSGMTPRAGYEYVRNLIEAKLDHLVLCPTLVDIEGLVCTWRILVIHFQAPKLPPRSTRTGRRFSFTIAV
jgi:hypothetical protein